MIRNPVSSRRQALIDAFIAEPRKAGDVVKVKSSLVEKYPRSPEKGIYVEIVEVEGDTLKVRHIEGSFRNRKEIHTVKKSDVLGVSTIHIGADPFPENPPRIEVKDFTLESILFNFEISNRKPVEAAFKVGEIEVQALNWNPFVYDKQGKKQRYQRDFVWSLEDKQNLILSLYNDVTCGRIIVRHRSLSELRAMHEKYGETELFFYDIIDGKQRLNAIREFITDVYPDVYGNFYSDLNPRAQIDLLNNQLISYAEMTRVKDSEVLLQFLKMNFTGVLQSREHLNYVSELYKTV